MYRPVNKIITGNPEKYTWFITVLILTFISGCHNRQSNEKAEPAGKEVVLKLLPKPGNPRNSEGDFITLKNGRILFIYSHYTGESGNDHGHAFLAGRYSDDNGETWSDDDMRIVEQEGTLNVMSVSLLRLHNGNIALFYLRKNSVTDCIPMMRISVDEAETWTDPRPCIADRQGYFVLNNNRIIQLRSGRLLLAVSLHQSPDEVSASERGRIWSYFSDDDGMSWICSREVPNPDSVIIQEPGLIELKNGKILMYMRTTKGVQYFSFSDDNGESWSKAEPSEIKSPCSPALITRIPSSGDLLMVWNDNGENQNRTPLNIGISRDEAGTWISRKIVENKPDGVYCYPAVHFTGKDILLNYSDWSTMGCTILKIDPDWVYGNR